MGRPRHGWIFPIWVDDPPEVADGIRVRALVDDRGDKIIVIIQRGLGIDRTLELLAAAGSDNLSEHYRAVGAPPRPVRMVITRALAAERPATWREVEGLVHMRVDADLNTEDAVDAMCWEAERVMSERWVRLPDPPPPLRDGVPG